MTRDKDPVDPPPEPGGGDLSLEEIERRLQRARAEGREDETLRALMRQLVLRTIEKVRPRPDDG